MTGKSIEANLLISQLLADLSRRMGLGLAVGEQTTGIDFEVDGRYAITMASDSHASLVLDCALRGVAIVEGEALNLLRYNLAAVRRDGIFVACGSGDGTLHLVKRLDLHPDCDGDLIVKELEALLDAADRWTARFEKEGAGASGGLIPEMSRFA
jgi:hypothetical protein